jgi:hypothetical protein
MFLCKELRQTIILAGKPGCCVKLLFCFENRNAEVHQIVFVSLLSGTAVA